MRLDCSSGEAWAPQHCSLPGLRGSCSGIPSCQSACPRCPAVSAPSLLWQAIARDSSASGAGRAGSSGARDMALCALQACHMIMAICSEHLQERQDVPNTAGLLLDTPLSKSKADE